ncbi:MAG: choice-of-anchor D domain-containing protein, partial [Vicinamibacteraceae bacterium]|nr:choice-of-anchor D domain-containing protein [Vicinamibacteraceae bacterium]
MAVPAWAQLSVTIRDISPNQSSSDAADPDGASGGRVNGLAADPSTAGRFWAASEWGGLWRSDDSGLTWVHVPGHVPVAMWDVAVDPANPNRIYATSFHDGRVQSRAGINVSTDGGVTWTHPASATPPAGFCLNDVRRQELSAFGIAIDPANAARVFVGTNCGLAMSTNSGATWTFVDPSAGTLASDIWDVVVHDGGIIDVCGQDGHFRSTNNGTTWTTATSQPLPGGRCSLAVSPDESYVLFAVVGTSIFESDDGGNTWPGTYANPSTQGRIPFVATNQRAGNTYDLWFGDVRLHRGTCTTPGSPAPGGAQRCNASGAWAGPFTRSVGGHDDTADIVFAPGVASDACPVLFSSDGGVYRNTNGASPGCHTPAWEQPNITPHALWNFTFTGVNRAGSGPEDLYFGNQDNGSFGTTGGGNAVVNWTNERCCDGFDTAGEAARGLSTICCFGGGRATRLFVSGAGLTGASPEIANYPGGNMRSFEHLNSLINLAANSYIAATTTGVFVTADTGATPWTQLGAGNSPPVACGTQLSFTGGAPTVFVKSGGCNGDTQGTLWRHQGTAAGGTWQQVPNPPSGSFGVYAVDRNNPQRIIASNLGAAGGPRMIMTTNGGTTWVGLPALDTLMTGGGVFQYQTAAGPTRFTGRGVYPQPTLVAFDPHDPDIVVAGGSDSGVFISTNGGTRWQLVTDPISPGTSGVPHVPRPYYAHFEHDSPTGDINLYLGTRGRGAWRLTFKKVAMPEVQVPAAPAFDTLCLGGSATDTLKVCNTSAGNLVVNSITSSNPEFEIVPPSGGFPVTISHDFCFPFQVKFTPTAAGSRTATFTINSNDPNFPAIAVEATGGGQTSDIRVTGSTDFGVVSAWKSQKRTAKVCNVGACPIDATSASINCTDFTLVNNPLPASLQPGGCLDVEVAYTPALPGRHSCELTVTSTSASTPKVTRTLTAETPPAVSVHAGIAWPHGSFANTLDHGSTLNIAFIDQFRPEWAWELRFGVSRLDGKPGFSDTDAWHLAPNIRFTFNPGDPWLVFANGGLGLYHFKPGDFEAGLNLGAGLRRPLNPRFAIEGTYNFQWAFTPSPTRRYSQVQGGLVVSF